MTVMKIDSMLEYPQPLDVVEGKAVVDYLCSLQSSALARVLRGVLCRDLSPRQRFRVNETLARCGYGKG